MIVYRIVTGTFLALLIIAGCGNDNGEQPPVDEQEQIDAEAIENDVDAPEADDQEVIDQQREELPEEENALPEETNEPGPAGHEPQEDADDPRDQYAEAEDGTDESSDEQADRDAVTISRDVINPDYENLLNEDDELVVSGRTVEELLDLIGEPPHLLRQGHRGSGWHKEIWILPIYQEDSTGLYIYIEDGEVADWRLDTFMGIGSHEQLLDWF